MAMTLGGVVAQLVSVRHSRKAGGSSPPHSTKNLLSSQIWLIVAMKTSGLFYLLKTPPWRGFQFGGFSAAKLAAMILYSYSTIHHWTIHHGIAPLVKAFKKRMTEIGIILEIIQQIIPPLRIIFKPIRKDAAHHAIILDAIQKLLAETVIIPQIVHKVISECCVSIQSFQCAIFEGIIILVGILVLSRILVWVLVGALLIIGVLVLGSRIGEILPGCLLGKRQRQQGKKQNS